MYTHRQHISQAKVNPLDSQNHYDAASLSKQKKATRGSVASLQTNGVNTLRKVIESSMPTSQ